MSAVYLVSGVAKAVGYLVLPAVIALSALAIHDWIGTNEGSSIAISQASYDSGVVYLFAAIAGSSLLMLFVSTAFTGTPRFASSFVCGAVGPLALPAGVCYPIQSLALCVVGLLALTVHHTLSSRESRTARYPDSISATTRQRS
jgi:hypothetical protein